MNRTSIIYKLISSKTNLIYIGSTSQTLSARLIGHRKKNNITRAKLLFEYGKEHVKIIQLATYENITKKELEEKENEYIKKYKDDIVNLKGTQGYTKLSKKEIGELSREREYKVKCNFCNSLISCQRHLKVHQQSKKCKLYQN
jgi:hypothetical protein